MVSSALLRSIVVGCGVRKLYFFLATSSFQFNTNSTGHSVYSHHFVGMECHFHRFAYDGISCRMDNCVGGMGGGFV